MIGAAQIVIAGNTTEPEAMCICEVLREMVQVRTQVVTDVVHSRVESGTHLHSADYLLVVLTKGLLRDPGFAQVLLAFMEAPGRARPPEIVTVLADTAFDFPGPELFERLEKEGLEEGTSGRMALGLREGARLALAFKELLNVLALGLSPHGSAAILATQVDEMCRRFRKYAEGSPRDAPVPWRSSTLSSEPISVGSATKGEVVEEARVFEGGGARDSAGEVGATEATEALPSAEGGAAPAGEERAQVAETKLAAAETKLAVAELENKALAAQLAAAEAESKALAAQLAAAEARSVSLSAAPEEVPLQAVLAAETATSEQATAGRACCQVAL